MAQEAHDVYGIDFRKDFIFIAQFSPATNAITSIAIQPFSDSTDDWWSKIKSEFREVVDNVDFKSRDVVCALPGEWAIIKKLMLDSDEEDVENALSWEISQQILGSLDDYACDHLKLASSLDNSVDNYLSVAYRCDSVKRLTDLMRQYNLNQIAADLDIFALINVYELNYPDESSVPAYLIYGDYDKILIVLAQKDVFIDFECSDFRYENSSAQECAAAIKQSKSIIARSNPQLSHDSLNTYLAGPVFSADEYVEAVLQEVPQAAILDPFKRINFHAQNISEEEKKKYSPQLAIAVGLAVRGGTE
ncbi:MAG: hypothetical protein GF398_04775 [Chitinivibrionales bacterium]|nr:hypothetical protein [Chitinivibrionales bacterium]